MRDTPDGRSRRDGDDLHWSMAIAAIRSAGLGGDLLVTGIAVEVGGLRAVASDEVR